MVWITRVVRAAWPTRGAFRRLELGSGVVEVISTHPEPTGLNFTTAQPEIRVKTLMLLVELPAEAAALTPGM